jgi:hypothetical protein
MSDAPQQSSSSSAENVMFVVGGFVGFVGSMFFWVIQFFVIMLVFSGVGNDTFTFPLLAGTPVLAVGVVIYFLVMQKPKGFILGLLIGAGFGFLLQGLCAFGFAF